MSNTTKAVTDGVVGPKDESELVVSLMGDDLDNLTPVEELPEGKEDEPSLENPVVESTEGLLPGCKFKLGDESLESLIEKSIQNAKACNEEGQCQGGRPPCPPCVSRVMDTDEKARITILLGPLERTTYLGIVIGLIDSASENDVVDLTVVGSPSGQAGTMSQRSILAAISRCKGHVITRAGALTTVGDVAIWLSGKEVRIPKMGLILMRQPVSGFVGDTADFESKLNDYKESMKEFGDFIVERGLFSQEEVDKMYTNRAILSSFGDDLRKRVANLKPVQ